MSILQNLIRHTRLLEIVGDLIRVRAQGVAFGDLAMIENIDGEQSLAKVVNLDRDIVSLQVFAGGKGLSTDAKVISSVVLLMLSTLIIFSAESSGVPARPSMAGPNCPSIAHSSRWSHR